MRGDPDRSRACRRNPYPHHASEDRTDQSEEVFDRDRFVATLATDYRLALVARTDMPFTLAAFVRPGGRDRPAVGVG